MKRLLFTGASGFLGENILPILRGRYEVLTLGRNSSCDISSDISAEAPSLHDKFDVVLHAAGKAHIVPKTESEKKEFFRVNTDGTKNLCDALEKSGIPRSLIFLSTVAVYGRGSGEDISEIEPLAGTTPYAQSKIYAEEFLADWCRRNGVALTILRPSLIAGVNAPGNLGAMVHGIRTGRYLNIGGGNAKKSILMASDIASLVFASEGIGGTFNACATHPVTFRELEKLISAQLGKSAPLSIPCWMAKCMAKVGDCLGQRSPINSQRLSKVLSSLTFSNEKARKELKWEPLDILKNYKI